MITRPTKDEVKTILDRLKGTGTSAPNWIWFTTDIFLEECQIVFVSSSGEIYKIGYSQQGEIIRHEFAKSESNKTLFGLPMVVNEKIKTPDGVFGNYRIKDML